MNIFNVATRWLVIHVRLCTSNKGACGDFGYIRSRYTRRRTYRAQQDNHDCNNANTYKMSVFFHNYKITSQPVSAE